MDRASLFRALSVFYAVAGGVALFVISMVAMGMLVTSGMVMAMLGAVLAGATLLVSAKAASNYRRWRAASVFFVIDQAVRLNLPLPHVIEATARGESYWMRDRLRALNAGLVSGAPLSQSLRDAVPGLSESAVQQIAAGEAVGQVPRALRRLVAQLRADTRRHPPAELLNWGYPLAIVLVMCMTLGWVTVDIVPKFLRIFEDFETPLPWMTRVTAYVAANFGLAIFAASCIMTAAVMGWAFVRLFVTPGGRRWRVPGRGLLDAIVWRVPALRGFSAERELGEACLAAADGIDAGLPLHAALHEASVVPVNRSLRRRVQRWADGANRGDTFADAARDAGMPGLLVGMIATAQSTSMIADAVRFIGNYYVDRTSRFAECVRSATAPLIVIVVALVVGWVVVSLFMPVVQLIRSATEIAL